MSLFITFEGPEGSGKTTQIRLLAEALEQQSLPVLTTREPGGTRIGNAIRNLVLDPANTEMSPRAEALVTWLDDDRAMVTLSPSKLASQRLPFTALVREWVSQLT